MLSMVHSAGQAANDLHRKCGRSILDAIVRLIIILEDWGFFNAA
jgi:hypothetical protein